MYKVFITKDFERSLVKFVRSGKFHREEAEQVLRVLSSGLPLPKKYRDHALHGDLSGRRECHIRGDILLIYRKQEDILVLIVLDIGTHHELFGT